MKSQTGQYITPLSSVGSKSLFNRAVISAPFSPVVNETILSYLEFKRLKQAEKNGVVPWRNAFKEKKTTVMEGP